MSELKKMPSPADLIERIKAQGPMEDLQDSIEQFTNCTKCERWAWCRKDGNHPRFECEDCYTGLTKEQRKQRWPELVAKLETITRKGMEHGITE